MPNKTQKHTPTPWGYEHADDRPHEAGLLILWGNVCLASVSDLRGDGEANARRIVDCVNACEGITDNELTHGPVVARHRHSYVINEREELKRQRDELLEALIAALPYVESSLNDEGYKPGAVYKIEQQMRRAIAKVKP